ncbi:hypothetical protein LIR45_01370 [Lachnospiraceae bacterium EP-SM-12S-S03]|nr:hypothetical protein [Lachnospiraceae bacterium EP-SM-12S-S03]
MQVLEKILAEIDKLDDLYYKDYVDKKHVKEIIQSHMDDGKDANVPSNDGWIPVEEWCLILRICYMREPDHGWHRNTEFFQKIGERI